MFLYADSLSATGSEAKAGTPAWEFYDLLTDPKENRNAYNELEYQPIIHQMKQELLRLRREVNDTDDSDPRMEQILKGYYW